MSKTTTPDKQVKIIPGKRTRWTILYVDEKIIKAVKDYADKNRITTARGIEELVAKALNGKF